MGGVASTESASAHPRVLIVIVNYRTGRLVVDCLRSLEREIAANRGARVVVVDNASGDDSAHVIASAIEAWGWSAWASLVLSPINGGFAYGNNYAVRRALADAEPPAFVWLLNPDTKVRPNAMRALIDFMDADPAVGVAGSLIEEADGKPWPFAFRFPSIFSEIDAGLRLPFVSKLLSDRAAMRRMGEEAAPVHWLPGASMMIRREVLETVGLMDEGYFLYFEETDFCLRVQRAGWGCWYVPQSRVMHIAGQSTGVAIHKHGPPRLPRYWFDSRRRYFVKNHGRAYAVATDLAWLASHMLWRGRRRLQRKVDPDPPHLLADFFKASTLLNADIAANAARRTIPPPPRQAAAPAMRLTPSPAAR